MWMEARFLPPDTPELLRRHYETNPNDIGYGIYADDQFVGVIRLQGIDRHHERADKHTFIDPEWWGRGIGTKATMLLIEAHRHEFRLITASCYENNVGVIKMNQRAGFVIVCGLPRFYVFDGVEIAKVFMAWYR